MLEFLGEHFSVLAVLEPPRFLLREVLLSGAGKTDVALFPTRAELTQNRVGIDKPVGLHVFVGIFQRLMQCGTIFVVEPVSGIERQELDFRSFG